MRHIEECSLSYYEGRPAVAQALIRRVQQTPAFRELEGRAEVKEAMWLFRDAFPGVAKGWPSDGNFNWMACYDYYVCRREHSLMNTALPLLRPIEALVCDHIAARYELYYTDPVHQAFFCAPMLADIDRAITQALASRKPALFFFSAHDVNLLALMYALQHPALADIDGPRYWPAYGTTLTFELSQEQQQEAVVRVTLDQEKDSFREFSQGQLRELLRNMQEIIATTSLAL